MTVCLMLRYSEMLKRHQTWLNPRFLVKFKATRHFREKSKNFNSIQHSISIQWNFSPIVVNTVSKAFNNINLHLLTQTFPLYYSVLAPKTSIISIILKQTIFPISRFNNSLFKISLFFPIYPFTITYTRERNMEK